MTPEINDLAARAGVSYFDYQLEALSAAAVLTGPAQRLCLYYKTGAGKSLTALSCVSLWGHDATFVIAPPSTHSQWIALGTKLGVEVTPMSHAKFRMKDTRLARDVPVIADEMHMFGGNTGLGWKKLSTLARGLRAPLVLASATPNYNDAERVYCIEAILDPGSTKGGFLAWLYKHCVTEQNPFSQTPLVTGFQRYPDAAAFLADLPGVEYLPDDLVYQINDVEYAVPATPEMDRYGYDPRGHRIIASQIEERHTRVFQGLVDEAGLLRGDVLEILGDLLGAATTPVLVYANHATVAKALGASLSKAKVNYGIVTGSTTKTMKDIELARFMRGELDVLVGTASLATGTDGIDKMCDWLVILDDTDDASLRRQLIGRIMPRGADTDASKKQVYRLLPQ